MIIHQFCTVPHDYSILAYDFLYHKRMLSVCNAFKFATTKFPIDEFKQKEYCAAAIEKGFG